MHRRRPAVVLAVALATTLIGGCSDDPGRITARVDRSTTTTTAAATTTTAAPTGTAGSADVGDAIVPGAGNGGYDVTNYDLAITVADDRTTIEGTATIEVTATQDLSAFNLDLEGLTVDDVTVDDEAATFTHEGSELTITPTSPIASGADLTTVVQYHGAPTPVQDPSAPGTIGWLSAPSGTYVAGEPTGARGFFPCNDHPSDKATFTIAVTAADRDTVVANGVVGSKAATGDGHTTWTFGQSDPMATYLVQIAVGDYDIVESTGPGGLPIRHAVVRSVTADQREVLDDTEAQLEFFESVFGPFPFDTYGLLVADSGPEFALETQTLTLLPSEWLTSFDPTSTSSVMAHELAHQWFGDAVTPARWSDIWLNEGFATYGEWLWNDHIGTTPIDDAVDDAMAQAPRWREAFGPVTSPAAPVLFSPNEYDGAGIVLHALRLTVGDDVFFEILRTWASERDGTSATTEDFQELATRLAGQDLVPFFDAWLRSPTLPTMPR